MKNAKYLVFVGIGVELFAYTMTALFLGKRIDEYFSTKGLFTALLIFVFGGFWFYRIMAVLKKMSNKGASPNEKD